LVRRIFHAIGSLRRHSAMHKAEIERWWPIIKTANIEGE
jgi:hypothetical protein